MPDVACRSTMGEDRETAALIDACRKPAARHNCTEPVTLVAGLHLALQADSAIFLGVVLVSGVSGDNTGVGDRDR